MKCEPQTKMAANVDIDNDKILHCFLGIEKSCNVNSIGYKLFIVKIMLLSGFFKEICGRVVVKNGTLGLCIMWANEM